MEFVLIVIISIIIILAAIFAILTKNLVSAIISAGVVSLLASIIYLMLSAPDVAMTEAAIGSGLTTVVFLYALNKIRKSGEDG